MNPMTIGQSKNGRTGFDLMKYATVNVGIGTFGKK